MSIKQWLTGRKTENVHTITLGRFSDLYKDESKYKAWDHALVYSLQEDYQQAYLHLFNYLQQDETDNFQYQLNEDMTYTFQFYQGSKVVNGYTDQNHFVATVQLAKVISSNLAVFRSLLEQNTQLNYSKYCIDNDNCICLKFETNHLDSDPYKLYYGLKEMSTLADHTDDTLTELYNEFEAVSLSPIVYDPSHIVKAKHEYLTAQLQHLKSKLAEDSSTSSAIQLIYEVGAVIYKLDYLLTPQSVLMKYFEDIIALIDNAEQVEVKTINSISHKIDKILTLSTDQLAYEFYSCRYTFGITNPASHHQLVEVIKDHMPHLKWNISQNNKRNAQAICDFILSKMIYEYALPKYDKELIEIYFRVTSPTFVQSVGMSGLVSKNRIKRKLIESLIDDINDRYQEQHHAFFVDKSLLMWGRDTFASSFIYMLSNLQAE